MVCVVWVGYDDNTDIGLKASDTALPLWAEFVKEAVEIRSDLGGNDFTRPGGIVTAEIDSETGMLASDGCSSRRQEVFISGTEPFAPCSHGFSEDYLMAESDDSEYPGEEDELGLPSSTPDSQISIDICSQTGKIASAYCEETSRRSYRLGSEPLEVCFGDGHRDKYNRDDARSMGDGGKGRFFPELPDRKGVKRETGKKRQEERDDD
jgi:hypothetical protein